MTNSEAQASFLHTRVCSETFAMSSSFFGLSNDQKGWALSGLVTWSVLLHLGQRTTTFPMHIDFPPLFIIARFQIYSFSRKSAIKRNCEGEMKNIVNLWNRKFQIYSCLDLSKVVSDDMSQLVSEDFSNAVMGVFANQDYIVKTRHCFRV